MSGLRRPQDEPADGADGCEAPVDVVFTDGPDPDNFVLALAALRMLKRPGGDKIHVVVTGRPVNFAYKSYGPKDIKESGKSIIKLLPRASDEKDDEIDSNLVLLDTIARFDRYLRAAGESGNYCLYNGLVSPNAPVSHHMHALDFMIDRASLVRGATVKTPVKGEVLEVSTEGGWRWGVVVHVPRHKRWVHVYCKDTKECLKRIPLALLRRAKKNADTTGCCAATLPDDILTIEEYRVFQAWYKNMSQEARQRAMREIPRRNCPTAVRSLEDLSKVLLQSKRAVRFLCGGPLTAVDKLLEFGGDELMTRVNEMNMMMCAWKNNTPGGFNLFKNQFNVGADSLSAQSVLIKKLAQLGDCRIRLVPTETCKNPKLSFTPETLEELFGDVVRTREASTILNMYLLWYNIGGRRPQICFDINPIICSSKEQRSMLEWQVAHASVDPDGSTVYIRAPTEEGGGEGDDGDAATAAKLLCAKADVTEEYARSHFKWFKKTFMPENSSGGAPTGTNSGATNNTSALPAPKAPSLT